MTRAQVHNAIQRLLETIILDNKSLDATKSHDDALDHGEALHELNERFFIKMEILPRIEGHMDLNWLYANGIRFGVMSSKMQLTEEHKVRIRIHDPIARQLWKDWLES